VKDDYETIQKVLKHGSNNYINNVCKKCDVDVCDENGLPIITWAVQQNKLIGVKLLLRRGADINKKDADGKTPLMHAVTLRGFAMTVLLCGEKYKYTLNVNTTDDDGWTAMNFALINGNARAVSILEKKGGKKGGL